MALQDLQARTTRDVDVLGIWNHGDLEVIDGFSPEVQACIERVVRHHPELAGLSERWVNLGPADIARRGLPDGFEKRLIAVRIGKRLTLQLLARADLLPLKLFAAADEFSPRREIHFDDLRGLSPTYDELDRAVEWVRTRENFENIRPEVKHVIERLGHDDLAYYV